MVIFQDRTSEGFASRTSVDSSPDSYFCLSFDQDTTTREALDAVTCASVFNSDKGRFLTSDDARNGYAEPFVEPSGLETMRPLTARSLYPPRRDVEGLGQFDHPDVSQFASEARRVMASIDSLTMATPAPDVPHTVQLIAPNDWEDGEYTAWIEVNVEGDYNDVFNDQTCPTPSSNRWDIWAETYGYPYRGQPSVVYKVSCVGDHRRGQADSGRWLAHPGGLRMHRRNRARSSVCSLFRWRRRGLRERYRRQRRLSRRRRFDRGRRRLRCARDGVQDRDHRNRFVPRAKHPGLGQPRDDCHRLHDGASVLRCNRGLRHSFGS